MIKQYTVEKIPVGQVLIKKSHLKLPSGHPAPDSPPFEDLKKSLSSNGMLLPLFVDSEKTIISGHYRYWAARDLKWKEVPVVVVDNTEDILKYVEKK